MRTDEPERVSVAERHDSTAQVVITTTADRVRLKVAEYDKKRGDASGWVAPACLLVTAGAPLLASDFRHFLLPPDAWAAVFGVVAVLAAVRLAARVLRARTRMTVEDFIRALEGVDQPE